MIISADLHGGTPTHDFPMTDLTMRAREFRATLEDLLEAAKVDPDRTIWLLGDVFDARKPPAWAYAIFGRFLADCAAAGVSVRMFRGNHDANALGEPGQAWSAYEGFRYYDRPTVEVFGDVGFIIIPWFGRAATAAANPNMTVEEQHEHMRRKLEELVAGFMAGADRADVHRFVVLTHFTISGATYSSETQPSLGASSEFMAPYKAFDVPSVEAVFAGHIHKPQQFGAGVQVYYPGSPIYLDFGETEARSYMTYDITTGEVARWCFHYATVLKTFEVSVAMMDDRPMLLSTPEITEQSVGGCIVRLKGELPHVSYVAQLLVDTQLKLIALGARRVEKPAITWTREVSLGRSISVNTDVTTALAQYVDEAEDSISSRKDRLMALHAQLLEEVRP